MLLESSANALPWWKSTTVYQVYPRSFCDSNGDGIGDLQGIVQRLDYLHQLGIETVWISPFFASPQADFGYDIRDHFSIAPEYGSFEDCLRLIDEVHARGMKVVFDMVLNHTSDQHTWFHQSRSSRRSSKRDWYIWRDGRRPDGAAPPNNWRSFLGGSGWHYDAHTDQWYWASFLPFQPDLNYRNPEVKQAMLDMVRYWLKQGVDGLRLDLFNAIYKDDAFSDNPFSFRPIPSEENPDGFFQRNQHTINHPDTIAFSRELRSVVDEFSDPPRFIVGEVFGSSEVLKQYCGKEAEGLNLVFLFKAMRSEFSAAAYRELIHEFETHFADPLLPTWVFGNHDRPRWMERLGNDVSKAKLVATLQMTARGVPFIYYGDEIGMQQHDLPARRGLDPVSRRFRRIPAWLARRLRKHGILLNRDECRPPMQWSDEPNAGFSAAHATPWLPLHPSATERNVAAQERDPHSLLAVYRRMLGIRKSSQALRSGRLELLKGGDLPDHVLGYRREHEHGRDQATVFLNFSERAVPLSIEGHAGDTIHSNLHHEPQARSAMYTLGAHEGIIMLGERA
jgi:oligo-1,6-glucosidase/alpha-glucosidase